MARPCLFGFETVWSSLCRCVSSLVLVWVLAACAPHDEAAEGADSGDVLSGNEIEGGSGADTGFDVDANDVVGDETIGDVGNGNIDAMTDDSVGGLPDTIVDGESSFDVVPGDADAAMVDGFDTMIGDASIADVSGVDAAPADTWVGNACSEPPANPPAVDTSCPAIPATGCAQIAYAPALRWSFDPPDPRFDSASGLRPVSGTGAAPWAVVDATSIGGGHAFYRDPDVPAAASGSGNLFTSSSATVEVLLRFRHPVSWSGLPAHALGNRTDLLAFNPSGHAPGLGYSREGLTFMLPGGVVNYEFRGGGTASWGRLGDGEWHHIAVTLETVAGGVRARLHIDGEQPEQFDIIMSGAFPTFATARVGFYKPAGVDVDELSIWPEALPATFIAQRAREARAGTRPADTDRCEARACTRPTVGGPTLVDLFERGFDDTRPYAPSVSPLKQYLRAPLPRHRRGHTMPRIISNWIHGPYSVADDDPDIWVRHGGPTNTLNLRSIDAIRAVEAPELVSRWNYAVSGLLTGDGSSYPNENPYTQYLRELPASIPVTIAHGKADEGGLGTPLVNASGGSLGLSPASPVAAFTQAGTAAAANLRGLEQTIGHRIDMVKHDWEGASGWVFQNVSATVWNGIANLGGNVATRDFCASRGLAWRACLAEGMTRLRRAYAEAHIATVQRGRPAIHFYDAGGNEHYQGDYAYTRLLNDPVPPTIDSHSDGVSDRFRYATPYVYPLNAYRWYYTVGSGRGLQWIYDARAYEIASGSPFMMPYVAAGWSFDERRNIRPPQWLGMLKVLTTMGALTTIPAFFVIPCAYSTSCSWGVVNDVTCLEGDLVCRNAMVPNPNRRAWQVLIPAYAQAALSQVEYLLRDPASVWLGDLKISHPNVAAAARRLGTTVVLAVAHMPNGTDRFHYQQMSSPVTVAIDHDGDGLTPPRPIRVEAPVQGAVYLFDFSLTPAVVAVLDGWHDWRHPDRWSPDLMLEAEVADAMADVTRRSSAPRDMSGDFIGVEGWVSVGAPRANESFERDRAGAPRVEFDVEIRGTETVSHAVWVRARTRSAGRPGRVFVWLDDAVGAAVELGCVGGGDWQWVRLDCARETNASLLLNGGTKHVLSVAPSHGDIEIDKVVLSPSSTCRAASATCGCP